MNGSPRGRLEGPEAFCEAFDVSRETIEKLMCYEGELRRWQKAVNLVAPSTLDEIWHRHFADSAQLAQLVPANAKHLADVGSGGGFPGLVLATVLSEIRDIRVTLVESDTRKAAFLRETARTNGNPCGDSVDTNRNRCNCPATLNRCGYHRRRAP